MALGLKPREIIEKRNYPLLVKKESWERIEINKIAKVQNGFAFKSSLFNNKIGLPLIRIRDVGRDYTETFYSGDYSEDYLVKKGDLIIGMDGDFRCAIWNGGDALLNQRVCRIFPNQKLIDKKFLYFILQPYLDAINEETSSVTVKHLSSYTVLEIPIPYPPLTEQKKIVEKIEELFSGLDSGVASLKKAKEQMRLYRQSVLASAFSGRLLPEKSLNHDSQDSEINRINSKNESRNSDNLNPENPSILVNHGSDNLPAGWKWVKLGEVTENLDGKRIPLSKSVRAKRKGEYRYFGATGVIDFVDDYIFDGKYLLIGEDGANLLSKSRSLSFVVEGKFWVNNHAHILSCENEQTLMYLMYYVNSLSLEPFVTGSAQPKLTQANMNRIPVPFPSINQ